MLFRSGPPAHDGEYDLYCPTVPRVNKAIELANREAKNRGHAEVGSEHLLIALISDDESLATALLLGLGVDLSVLATTLAKEAGWLR